MTEFWLWRLAQIQELRKRSWPFIVVTALSLLFLSSACGQQHPLGSASIFPRGIPFSRILIALCGSSPHGYPSNPVSLMVITAFCVLAVKSLLHLASLIRWWERILPMHLKWFSSGLQRRTITDPPSDAEAPPNGAFLTALYMWSPLGPFSEYNSLMGLLASHNK